MGLSKMGDVSLKLDGVYLKTRCMLKFDGSLQKDVSLNFDRSIPKGYTSLKLDGSIQKRCIPSLKVNGSNAKRKNPSCIGAQRKRAPKLYVHILVIGVLLQIIVLQYLCHFNTCP